MSLKAVLFLPIKREATRAMKTFTLTSGSLRLCACAIGLLLASAIVCPAQVTFTEYQVPAPDLPYGGPESITTASDGNLWFPEPSGNSVGRITTSGVITEFPVRGSYLLQDIVAGPDGN